MRRFGVLLVGVICIGLCVWFWRGSSHLGVVRQSSAAEKERPNNDAVAQRSSTTVPAVSERDANALNAMVAELDRREVERVPKGECVGVVWEASPDPFEQVIDKLEQARSLEEANRALVAVPSMRPVVAAAVIVQGASATWRATTDAKGRFSLPFLPEGVYEFVAEKPAETGRAVATGSSRVKLDGLRSVNIQVRPDTITIRGRVCDDTGRPIAGASIFGEKAFVSEQAQESGHLASIASTISSGDGTFELRGFVAPNPRAVCAYLEHGQRTGHQGTGMMATLTTKVEGYDECKTIVPLITEELLGRVRRFEKAISRFQQTATSKPAERMGTHLPPSQGNAIVDVNVVLRKRGS